MELGTVESSQWTYLEHASRQLLSFSKADRALRAPTASTRIRLWRLPRAERPTRSPAPPGSL
eukprot:6214226-Pleurochrysis_carterae.AAC.2